ncbi:glycosyl hydrolase family 17 protein [Amycolatopsis benzoatilytica]|uniref:glycosyl hydrolase family 17 protein n=1 Tax=Amycolatopsis benzoatilytica TaxID=346045 RepID=UPI0003805DAC|nr:glycosyl hydrolase family 17 protein [Amycolatopsis benzoatilytica]
MIIRIKRCFRVVLVACTLVAIVPATDVHAAPQALVMPMFGGAAWSARQQDGSCITTEEATVRLNALKQVERLAQTVSTTFPTSGCDTLRNLVPAAEATGLKVNVVLFASEDQFRWEVSALENLIRAFGSDWINTVSVGYETLYGNQLRPHVLAEMIYEVKGMVQIKYRADVPVGTSEPWTSWVDGANAGVSGVCDFVGLNVFPHRQGKPIDQGLTTLQHAVYATREATSGKPLVVTETGWPSAGPTFGEAVASLENQEKYFNEAVPWLLQEKIPYVWFSGWDEPGDEQDFGVFLPDGTAKFPLTR